MDIPFIYGRLADKESFIDRVEDRRELKNFLRHGINVILVSPRRWENLRLSEPLWKN